jgi:hypothetical protein
MDKTIQRKIPTATLNIKVTGNINNTEHILQSVEYFLELHTPLHHNPIFPIIGPINSAMGIKIKIKSLIKIF